ASGYIISLCSFQLPASCRDKLLAGSSSLSQVIMSSLVMAFVVSAGVHILAVRKSRGSCIPFWCFLAVGFHGTFTQFFFYLLLFFCRRGLSSSSLAPGSTGVPGPASVPVPSNSQTEKQQ